MKSLRKELEVFDYEGGVSHEAYNQQALEKEALEMQKEQVRNSSINQFT